MFDIGLLKSPLEDDLVQDALRKGTDLRQYSKQIEKELQDVENASIAGITSLVQFLNFQLHDRSVSMFSAGPWGRGKNK